MLLLSMVSSCAVLLIDWLVFDQELRVYIVDIGSLEHAIVSAE